MTANTRPTARRQAVFTRTVGVRADRARHRRLESRPRTPAARSRPLLTGGAPHRLHLPRRL